MDFRLLNSKGGARVSQIQNANAVENYSVLASGAGLAQNIFELQAHRFHGDATRGARPGDNDLDERKHAVLLSKNTPHAGRAGCSQKENSNG